MLALVAEALLAALLVLELHLLVLVGQHLTVQAVLVLLVVSL
jgi:hypothetical protein